MNIENNDPFSATEGLPLRFDRWYRKTIRYLLLHEVRKLINYRFHFELMDDIYMIEEHDETEFENIDKDVVILGDVPLYTDNPKLIRAINMLSDTKKQIIADTVIHEIPVKTVARRMNLAEQTVKNYRGIALRHIRDYLGEPGNE